MKKPNSSMLTIRFVGTYLPADLIANIGEVEPALFIVSFLEVI